MLRPDEYRKVIDREKWNATDLAELAHVGEENLSRWRNGRTKKLSAGAVARVDEWLNNLLAYQKTLPEGARIDFSNIPALRKRIQDDGRNRPPTKIDQEYGIDFIKEFCAHLKMSPEEFLRITCLRTTLANATIFSAPAQRWMIAWAKSICTIVGAELFSGYSKGFASRDEAMERLSARCYTLLAKEIGEKQLDFYAVNLLLTGEFQKSPTDENEN